MQVAQLRSLHTTLWRMLSSGTRWQEGFMYDGAKLQRGGVKLDAVMLLIQGCMPQVQRKMMNLADWSGQQQSHASRATRQRRDRGDLPEKVGGQACNLTLSDYILGCSGTSSGGLRRTQFATVIQYR